MTFGDQILGILKLWFFFSAFIFHGFVTAAVNNKELDMQDEPSSFYDPGGINVVRNFMKWMNVFYICPLCLSVWFVLLVPWVQLS